MFNIIKTIKQNRAKRKLSRRIKMLKVEYDLACNDLACFKFTLKKAIRKGNDRLSAILRDAITDSTAECNTLRCKMESLSEIIENKKNGGN